MESLRVALNAVVPFIIYLAFGYILRRAGILDEAFAKKINRFIFKGFFPIMMFRSMYSMEHGSGTRPAFMALLAAAILAVIFLGILIVPRFEKEDGRIGVIVQALYRSNTVLFWIPLATSVLGETAGNRAALLLAVTVPLYNFAAVILLSHYGHITGESVGEKIRDILTNPLISGSIVGLIVWGTGIKLPSVVLTPINAVADMTTPLAIIILGAIIKFASMKNNLKYHVAVIAVKMLLIPLALLGLSFVLDLSSFERFMLVTLFAVPDATACFNMAYSMNCDGDLAGELVVSTTVISLAVLFMWIFLLKFFALI
ncbi:MAG: AEC family transporter [Lachnospiraceae bacterium]|nr:AEC family transporter [Lachnospiraceae bacterium]